MFLKFYGLHGQPFGVSPNPYYFYPSYVHRQALAALTYGIDNKLGFGAVVGAPGMGKTVLLFSILKRYQATTKQAFVFDTQCSGNELLSHILSELGARGCPDQRVALHQHFVDVLRAQAQKGHTILIAIDEAQNLVDDALEAVRLLSNFETADSKLLHIILSGQPQFMERLCRPEFLQLRQRIPFVRRLDPLSAKETAEYIQHRLHMAGSREAPIFTEDAIDSISTWARGVPRMINAACFAALSLGYASRARRIDAGLAEEALAELQGVDSPQSVSAQLDRDAKSHVANATFTVAGASDVAAEALRASPKSSATTTATATTTVGMPVAAEQTSAGAESYLGRETRSWRPSVKINEGARWRAVPRVIVRTGAVGLSVWLLFIVAGVGIRMHTERTVATPAVGQLGSHADNRTEPVPPPTTAIPPPHKRTVATYTDETRVSRSKAQQGTDRQSGPSYLAPNVGRPAGATSAEISPPSPLEIARLAVASDGSFLKSTPVSTYDLTPPAVLSPVRQRDLQPARLLHRTPVNYPALARAAGVEGTVIVSAVIGPNGKLRGFQGVQGDERLVKAAIESLRNWVYQPELLDGQAVETETLITFEFSLDGGT